jgi:hypothetical protein
MGYKLNGRRKAHSSFSPLLLPSDIVNTFVSFSSSLAYVLAKFPINIYAVMDHAGCPNFNFFLVIRC